MPLAFLVRRSTFDSTSARATAQASTPGVFSPVDTPSSVRHTPSRLDDVLRWCFPPGVPLKTLPPDTDDDDDDDSEGAVAGTDPDLPPNSVDDKKQPALLLLVAAPTPVGRDTPRQDVGAVCSTKCIGDRAPGVEISTSISPPTPPQVDEAVVCVLPAREEGERLEKTSQRELLLLLEVLLLLGCCFLGGTIVLPLFSSLTRG